MTFNTYLKIMESWVGTKTYTFYSCNNVHIFFRNLQKTCLAGSVALFKHVVNYMIQGKIFRIITRHPPPNRQGSPLSHWGHNEQFCGFKPCEFSPVPSSLKDVYIYIIHKRKCLSFLLRHSYGD